MKALFVSLFLWLTFSNAVQSQGLIGAAPEGADPNVYFNNQRRLATQLELERSKRWAKGLTDSKRRTEYGSIVWKLGLTYESLGRWQDALAAYNTLRDLKLPANAMSHCGGCVVRASDAVIAVDEKRLQSKVNAVESVDHVEFDHNARLETPGPWTIKQEQQLEAISRTSPLSHGQVMTMEELFK